MGASKNLDGLKVTIYGWMDDDDNATGRIDETKFDDTLEDITADECNELFALSDSNNC